jgi:HD-GYP domain-containing protein (c-di-GMP phosphodiesterase class II)
MMEALISLAFPVVTLEGQVLLPAGTLLSEQVLAEVAASGRLVPRDQVALLAYGQMREDLQRCLLMPPYAEIVGDRPVVDELLERMGHVRLPLPLLHALEHFRVHDFHTYRHILTVFALSTLVAEDVVPGYHARPGDVLSGPTHDFGKLCIPLAILKKSSPLTRQERRLLDHHPLAGQVLLTYYFGDHRHPAVIVARDHHERRDGSGYPRGISDLQPIVELVATCDVYDALLSPRPYRPLSFDNRTALEELTLMAEQGKLGWESVTALVARNRKGQPGPSDVIVSRDRRGVPPAGNCYGTIVEDDERELAVPSPVAAT